MVGIFGTHAQRHWDAGLPVIPLIAYDAPITEWVKSPGKQPAIRGWQQYGERMPSADEQANWLAGLGDGNMGLPLGPQSGLVAFDVDTEDGAILEIIEGFMTIKSPWRRVGAKGYVVLYRYEGQKTFRIKDMAGNTICELLSAGTQVVLPPSIHPKTKAPYIVMGDVDLVGLTNIPMLPPDFERSLRAALTSKKVRLSMTGNSRLTEYVPRSSRDTKYTAFCGTTARDVLRGGLTLKDAIKQVENFPELFTEQVAGDNLDPRDGVSKLIRFLVSNVRDDGLVLRRGWDTGLTDEDKVALGIDFNGDEQARTYKEIIDLFNDEMGEAIKHEDEDEKLVAIQKCLSRIHRSPQLDATTVDKILRFCATTGGMRLSIVSLRKDLAKLGASGLEGNSHYEIAAHALGRLGDIRYHLGRFWRWEGSFWEEEPNHNLLSFITVNYSNLPACKKQNDYLSVVKTMTTLATKELGTEAGRGVNFANGFLGMDMVLRPHNPDHGLTYRLGFQYLPEKAGKCPKFFKFLEDAWGLDADYAEKKMALQEAICSTLFGTSVKMGRAVLLYGEAHSGKSVLLRVVESMLPSSRVSAISPDVWGDKFAPASMCGKLLNVGGELHETKKIDGQKFKQIIVGETINGQFKNQALFDFRPECAHWFASNYLPQSNDTSEGFYRRWLMLTFEKAFPEAERNVNLAEDIVIEESEAIMAWAVEAMSWLSGRMSYTLPPSHETRVRELMADHDTVYFFLRESQRVKVTHLTLATGGTGGSKSTDILGRTLFDEYLSSTVGRGARPVSPTTFSRQMRQHSGRMGYQVVLKTSAMGFQEIFYAGLTLVGANGRAQVM